MGRTSPPALELRIAPVLLAAVVGLGCASIPSGRAAVDSVEIEGASKISAGDIEDRLATTPSPKFLGLFPGVVFDYEIFDRYVFQLDVERVERFYRARGFYQAHARAGRVAFPARKHVRVTIEVEEGPVTVLRNVWLKGTESLPKADADAASAAANRTISKGRRFDEDHFRAAESAVQRALTDRGYAFAKVTRSADVDLVRHYADATFDVDPDQLAKFGAVKLEGLGSLPEEPVRRALDLQEGTPYSSAELNAAQQAVLDLGVFSSVLIRPELSDPPPGDRRVPVTVKLEPARLRAVRVGGGVELDVIRTELHARVGWEDRNFLGGFRYFKIDATPGAVLYPTRVSDFQMPTKLLPEAKVRTELRQPGLFEARTSAFLRGQFNLYPLLLGPRVDLDAPVLGYRDFRAAAAVDRTFWKLYVSPSYDLQLDTPFAYVGSLDPTLREIMISYVDLLTNFDYRDDPVKPHKGFFLGNDLQIAGGLLGGDARDVRIQPEARLYIPASRRVTLATRGTVGFLFPFNYGETLSVRRSVYPPDAAGVRDDQLAYFRGFFSGGPNSNRGYPYRSVAPHGIVPFACSAAAALNPLQCSVPLGGLSLWEVSVELRFPVLGPLSGAIFVDSGDASPHRANLRLDHLHLSTGLGIRYETPVGPIRLDVGYRLPGLQVLVPTDPAEEGDPGTLFGAPIAVAFGIGEAF